MSLKTLATTLAVICISSIVFTACTPVDQTKTETPPPSRYANASPLDLRLSVWFTLPDQGI